MSNRALAQLGNRAVAVANDVCAGSPYRANVRAVPPATAIPGRRDEKSELLLFVEHGRLEVMIDGAAAFLGKGEFARVKPGAWYAYRNVGHEVARLLTVPVPRPGKARSAATITVEFAA
jgi:mannose-6-phosphate isomerase-like protein (cupin superfamily)